MDNIPTDRRKTSDMELRILAVEIELEHVKAEVINVKDCLTVIDEKLDKALESKADREELKEVNAKLNSRLPLWASFAGSAQWATIGALLAALYFLINYYHR
jgi:hypothetical protein